MIDKSYRTYPVLDNLTDDAIIMRLELARIKLYQPRLSNADKQQIVDWLTYTMASLARRGAEKLTG